MGLGKIRDSLFSPQICFVPTREHTEVGIVDFDRVWHECSCQKNIRPIFSLSAMIDVEGVRTTFKFRGAEYISSNISEIIKDEIIVDETSVF